MSVYSMTGYASAQSAPFAGATPEEAPRPNGPRLGVEIRAVNSRFLDLSFRLPDELRSLEPVLRELLVGRLKRGKVELRAGFESSHTSAWADPPAKLLQRLNGLQDSVRAWLPQATPLSVAEVLALCPNERVQPQAWQEPLLALAQQALDGLLEARAREGEKLVAMLRERLQGLRELVAQAQPLVPKLVAQQRQRFLDRWAEALSQADPAPNADAAHDRALSEATALALRIDVAEELSRLGAHLDEIERLLQRGGEVGKRLDFLIQELHREANTLGSKSATLEMTHIAVDMKVLIEQMREQVQNLE
ncbi:MAG: YicC family protein [Rhodoferax sp.]